jgi:hypothetical protein
MSLVLEGGKRYNPKPSDQVRCDEHGVVTTWGKLDWIGKLAVESGLDSTVECLLLSGSAPAPHQGGKR